MTQETCQSVRIGIFEAGKNVDGDKTQIRIQVQGNMALFAMGKDGIFVDAVFTVDVGFTRLHGKICGGALNCCLHTGGVA